MDLYQQTLKEYHNHFNDQERLRLTDKSYSYSEELKEMALSENRKPFFPSTIKPHKLLKGSIYAFFKIREGIWLDNNKPYESEILSSYLDMVQLYWLGYLAFIEEFSGSVGAFHNFVEEYKLLTPYDFPSKKKVQYIPGFGPMRSKEYEEFLQALIVYYALEISFSTSSLINVPTRVNALKLWQKYDPEYNLYFADYCRYGFYYKAKIDNILPESFAFDLDPEEFHNMDYLFKNAKFCNLLNLIDSSQENLTELHAEYQAEIIQVYRSILNLNFMRPTHLKVIKILMDLIKYDIQALESYFGSHCSFRNKGRVTKELDDIGNMDRQLLNDVARKQRREIRELREKLAQREQLHQILCINNLLSTLDERVDTKRYFFYFCINPMLTFEANLDNIRQMYRKYSRENHPDRAKSEKERVKLEELMKLLNEAYDVLKNEASYNKYLNECIQRAQNLVSNF